MAMPGTLYLFSRPSHFVVMPSWEMPYSAREPSMVAVFIDRSSPAIRHTTSTFASALPTSTSKACV